MFLLMKDLSYLKFTITVFNPNKETGINKRETSTPHKNSIRMEYKMEYKSCFLEFLGFYVI